LKGFWTCRVGDFVGLDEVLETVGLRLILPLVAVGAFHVFLFGGLIGDSSSTRPFLDLRRNGLFEKKPDRFFCTLLSGEAIPGNSIPLIGAIFVGELAPDMGSALVNELGAEYSLWLSLLSGRALDDNADPLTEGGALDLQNMVIPSVGY
jgi:hypothetical protein